MKHRLHREIAPLVMGIALLCSCSANRQQVKQEPPQEQSFSATPPFKTIEPQRYRAERVYTFTNREGNSTVTRSSIARDADLRREELEVAGQKIVLIDNSQGRLVLLPGEKIYSDLSRIAGSQTVMDLLELGSSPERLLHEEGPSSASYQTLGNEDVSGRATTKYRVVVNNSGNSDVKLEAVIWIDESLGMPIRSETKSPDGRQLVTELTNISLNVDSSLFQIPEGYKQVAAAEIMKRLGKE